MNRPERNGERMARGGIKLWLGDSRSVDRIVYALCALCALLVLGDLFVDKHGPFAIEHWFGFYSIYGFAACVALVFAARQLRRVVTRPEDYYDR